MNSTYGKILAAALALSISVPALAAEVDARQANQQARIDEGVRSGQLTPREATHLERREAKTRREIRRDRAANGGRLTAGEKAKINREQNRTSRRVFNKKHNARHM
jgi:hypothetical protein